MQHVPSLIHLRVVTILSFRTAPDHRVPRCCCRACVHDRFNTAMVPAAVGLQINKSQPLPYFPGRPLTMPTLEAEVVCWDGLPLGSSPSPPVAAASPSERSCRRALLSGTGPVMGECICRPASDAVSNWAVGMAVAMARVARMMRKDFMIALLVRLIGMLGCLLELE